ncbi:MAG: PAS domain S-box protein [Acidobacteriota bacterium]|nr:PAS domain S-box protein [Acidobacteriota bacterium]
MSLKFGQNKVVQSELLEILDLAQAFVRDLDGTIRSWSTGATQLYGWKASEAVGRISHELLKTKFSQPLAEIQAELLDNRSWRGELSHTASDGRAVTVVSHWSLYQSRSNSVLEVVEVNNDISELKEAQRELVRLRRENENRLKELETAYEIASRLSAIVESSNDAIIGESLDGLITSWNGGAEKIFGYKADEIIGKPVSVLAASDRSNEMPSTLTRIRRGETVKTYETVRRRKDGRLIDISLTVSPIYNAQCEIEGASKTARDITDKKHAERLLLNKNEELRQFAYAAAHDLQEPIRDISLYAQMITKHCSDHLDDKTQRYIDIVLGGARRMQGLIQDLLTYTKATSGPKVVEPASSSTSLSEALENLREDIGKTGACVHSADSLPLVLMHKAHLTALFQHLLVNAIKYSGPRTPEIHVSAERTGREWRFSVRDNGIGIDRQHWSRIFGVFKRLHGREIPGTGIGLALCHRIVTHYGGRMWVESVVDQGSTFHFTVLAAD